MPSIGAIAPISALAALQTLAGPVFSNCQYTLIKTADRPQIQRSPHAFDAILHDINMDHSIQTIQNCEQQRNDLSVVLICFGHVLRRTKPLKVAILWNYFCVGWIVGLLLLC
jgi:hypothetical protein